MSVVKSIDYNGWSIEVTRDETKRRVRRGLDCRSNLGEYYAYFYHVPSLRTIYIDLFDGATEFHVHKGILRAKYTTVEGRRADLPWRRHRMDNGRYSFYYTLGYRISFDDEFKRITDALVDDVSVSDAVRELVRPGTVT